MSIVASRELGVSLAARQLWRELGLDHLLEALPQSKSAPVAEAVFRMVVNRLSDPLSKLAVVEWQAQIEWPSATSKATASPRWPSTAALGTVGRDQRCPLQSDRSTRR
jgi:hypothetical protein